MIKFRIFSEMWEEKRCEFGEVLEKCQNHRFFDIFWDILDKRNCNFGHEYLKRELLSFQNSKIRTIAPDFPEKMIVFPVLAVLFNLFTLKFVIPTHIKIIFWK